MVEAGWYPDPQNGEQERYWDGQEWTDRVQAPQDRGQSRPITFNQAVASPVVDPQPAVSSAPATAEPVRTGRSRWPVLVVGVVLMLGLVLAAVGVALGWFRGGGATPSPTPSQSSSTSESSSDGQSSPTGGKVSKDLCTTGNNRFISMQRKDTLQHTGMSIDLPADYGFRLDKSQFPWLDDVYPFGQVKQGQSAVIVGRQPPNFPKGADAVRQAWLCWTTSSMTASENLPEQLSATPEAITTNGLKGYRAVATYKDGWLDIRVYTSQGENVVVYGYHDDKGASTQPVVEKSLNSVRPG